MAISNIEQAADDYAKECERRYIVKRGGSVPVSAALSVYLAAFNSFIRNA